METSLVLLTKNEIVGLRKLLPEIKKSPVGEIICMDCNSTDGTQEFLRKNGIPVSPHST